MPRPRDDARRRELLHAVIDAFARNGIGRRPLRAIADEVGTSHRMLLHHFGSRDELIVAVVEEVERRQAAVFDTVPAEPVAAFAAMWADLRRPELRALERLFFECYARAAQGEAPFTRLLPTAVQGWLDAADRHGTGGTDAARDKGGAGRTDGADGVGRAGRTGHTDAAGDKGGEATNAGGGGDPALARLGLAVMRGLLLDLVATDDEAGVDAAAAAFGELLRAAAPVRVPR